MGQFGQIVPDIEAFLTGLWKRAAGSIVRAVQLLGIQVRAGVHTGECEVLDGKPVGVAVHVGARVAAAAGPSEVLATGTAKDLVAGSGITFEDRGMRALKGLPGQWRLFAVADT